MTNDKEIFINFIVAQLFFFKSTILLRKEETSTKFCFCVGPSVLDGGPTLNSIGLAFVCSLGSDGTSAGLLTRAILLVSFSSGRLAN